MRLLLLTALGTCLMLSGSSASAYTYWNHIRHSALLPDSTITVRVESPTGAGVSNYILYQSGGVLEEPMTEVADGPSTVAADVPGPVAGSRYYGFRLLQGEEVDLMPVRIGDGVDPGPADLSRLAEDPAGDHLYGFVNLDLVDCRMGFSGARIYAALENAGGGFPVISGLTFFGYLLGIANPAQSDPDTVFGMMHTFNQPGIITPGLYKITGPGMGDLIKIGEVVIEEFPALNTLMISCELADLMADPFFLSWYNPADPAIGVAAFTQRITLLGGAKESDRSPGGRCYLRDFAVAPDVNHLPELSAFRLEGSGAEAFAEITYDDANGNCPVLAEIVFDDTLSFPMRPMSLDYGEAVAYRTSAGILPLAEDSWTDAVVRFSDDGTNVVEYEPATNAVPDSPWPGDRGGSALRTRIFPNPFQTITTVEMVVPARGPVRVGVYGVRGGLVRTLMIADADAGPCKLEWDGTDDSGQRTPAGIYFFRVEASVHHEVHKVVSIR